METDRTREDSASIMRQFDLEYRRRAAQAAQQQQAVTATSGDGQDISWTEAVLRERRRLDQLEAERQVTLLPLRTPKLHRHSRCAPHWLVADCRIMISLMRA